MKAETKKGPGRILARVLEGSWTSLQRGFRLLVSQTVREPISVVISQLVSDILQQPQEETNTMG